MVKSFLRSPSGTISLAFLALILLTAVFAPIVLGHQAEAKDIANNLRPPSGEHWFGTDNLGRDLFARIVVATRLSLGLALGSVLVSAAIGIPLGALAPILGPRARSVLLRTVDILLAFPGIILAIYATVIVGRGNLGPIIGVGIAGSFAYARVTSALAMSIGSREFVQAARVVGIRGPKLLFRHILPNVADTLIIATTVNISTAIVAIAGLSFLGVGVQLPDYDWGRLLTDGVRNITLNPVGAFAPAIAIALTALSFGFFGEALARALNPMLAGRQRRRAKDEAETAVAPSVVASAPRAAEQNKRPVDIALEVEDLHVSFPGQHGPVEVVTGVSFAMSPGERVGIVGESGSGKTMTAMAIAKLISYPGNVTGRITIDGTDVLAPTNGDRRAGRNGTTPPTSRAIDALLSTHMAVVFQDPMSSLNPALTVGTQLTEAVVEHRGVTRSRAVNMAIARLREVQIPVPRQQLSRYPHQFSGGMRQRILIAMGLMNEPKLLIADEPTTALDVTIQAQIMDLIQEISTTHGAAVILISHNLGLIKQNCDRVIVMYSGHLVEELPASDLDNARHPYTKALLAAVPDMSRPRDEPLSTIPGQAPDPASPPSGCRFHDRCPVAIDTCATQKPPLLTLGGGQRVACWVANEGVAA